MEEKLDKLHADVREWLKFAETKNILLITLNSAAISLLLTGIKNIFNSFNIFEKSLSCLIIFLLAIVILNSLFSALPSNGEIRYKKNTNKAKEINLLYYGSLANFTPNQLVKDFSKKFSLTTYNKVYCIEQAKQIISLSIISKKKNKHFKISIVIDIITLILIIPLVYRILF